MSFDQSLRAAHNLGLMLLSVWLCIQIAKDPPALELLKCFGWLIVVTIGWTVFITAMKLIEVLLRIRKERGH